MPPGPWLFTGGLENYPYLIDDIAGERPLWGNPGPVLERVRDPVRVASALSRCHLPCPAISWEAPPPKEAHRWLLKPRRGAGGQGIKFWRPDEKFSPGCYWQEFIEGEAVAAMYLGQQDRTCSFLGLTRQLVGEPWLHAAPFQYCGSIGPLPWTPTMDESLKQLGQALVGEFALRGLFGVDCILRDNVPWPVEVNPRFPASAELFDLNFSDSLIADHIGCFARQTSPQSGSDPGGKSRGLNAQGSWAKAILYAREDLVFPAVGLWSMALKNVGAWNADPWFADIPAPGMPISAGSPVLTFFSRGHSPGASRQILQEIAGDLDRELFWR